MPQITTVPVLIVGAGPVGMMASILLDQMGVGNRLIDRRPAKGRAPAAHVVNARTFEICRGAGIDMDALMAKTGNPTDAGRAIWVTRLAGQEIASLPFERQDDSVLDFTPTPLRNLGQHHFERVLHDRIDKSEAIHVEFDKQWEGASRTDDYVESKIVDLTTGRVEDIRSEYVIAADGAGSRIRASVEIELIGPPKLQSFVMIHFNANLRELVRDRPGILYWISDPEAGGTFVAHNIDSEWVYMLPFDSDVESIDDYDASRCAELVLRGIGREESKVEIETISTWNMSSQVAERFSEGRVFLAGDAAHRFPPTGGLGLNSGIQDVHGLAWRFAAVLKNGVSPELLDSYDTERRPVAQYNADQSLRNAMKLIEVPSALGVLEEPTTARMQKTLDDPAGRAATLAAISNQAEHFDMLGLQLGYQYENGAIIPDGSPAHRVANPVREFRPTTRPGARLPHAWLIRGDERISSLDLILPGTFLLLTSVAQSGWSQAVDGDRRVPILHIQIGGDVLFESTSWTAFSEVEEAGALLIRPDQHVAWRVATCPDDPKRELEKALDTILLA